MDELKNNLKLLNDDYNQKQLELKNLYKLIMKTQEELQNKCHHGIVHVHRSYDGHRTQYYTVCENCDKQL